jgi:hypothetical protein
MARYMRVILDVELGAEPIAGRVSGVHGDAEPFVGWLELAAALERAGGASGAGSDAPAPGIHNSPFARTVANAGKKSDA